MRLPDGWDLDPFSSSSTGLIDQIRLDLRDNAASAFDSDALPTNLTPDDFELKTITLLTRIGVEGTFTTPSGSLAGEDFRIIGTIESLSTHRTSTEPIPEPTTMLLLGSGLIGLAGFRRRARKGLT